MSLHINFFHIQNVSTPKISPRTKSVVSATNIWYGLTYQWTMNMLLKRCKVHKCYKTQNYTQKSIVFFTRASLSILDSRLAQLAGRPHKLSWPRIWSSKSIFWDSRDIRVKNAESGVSWGKKGQVLASNIRSASQASSYEAGFPED